MNEMKITLEGSFQRELRPVLSLVLAHFPYLLGGRSKRKMYKIIGLWEARWVLNAKDSKIKISNYLKYLE